MFLFFNDFAYSKQIGFQDPATPIMEGIIDLHDDIMFYMVVVGFVVGWVLISIFQMCSRSEIIPGVSNNSNTAYSYFSHNVALEVVWTIIPSVILFFIALPSFSLLYAMDEIVSPGFTLKTVGHQWYWSYEYNDYVGACEETAAVKGCRTMRFDSYLKGLNYNTTFLRLLDVDKQTIVPANVHVRLLVTSADVLHSWAVPSLGIKLDACPGRLNETHFFIKRVGLFYGQCSEICGINHGFMPIVVNATDNFYDHLYTLMTLGRNAVIKDSF